MHVSGPSALSHVHAPQQVAGPHRAASADGASAAGLGAVRDEVQISEMGSLLSQVHELPDVRGEKVEAIRAALAEGTYDIDGTLEVAVGRLLDEIA